MALASFMKLHPVFLLISILVFSLGSCKKELSQETPTHNSSGGGTFYATIDGQSWQGDSLQQAIAMNGTLTITGIGKTQEVMAIVLPGFQTGVYTVNAQSAGYAFFGNPADAATLYLSNSSPDPLKAGGTVTLTMIDTVNKTVSGTFQFNLFEGPDSVSISVTAGVFSGIPYTGSGGAQNPPPPAGSTDTLIAQIDGVDWEAAQVLVGAQTGQLVIGGVSASARQSVGLYMPDSVAAGTYAMNFADGKYFAMYNPDPSTVLLSIGNGSLTVIENDMVKKHISGNFSFVAKSEIGGSSSTVSNGYFSVDY